MKIAIIGTGYVGLVTGTCLADIGHEVLCVDNNEDKVKMLRNGEIPIYEPGLKELVEKNVAAKRLSFSSDTGEAVVFAKVIFIAVSTPSRPDGSADLSFVEHVARDVAIHMNEYKVVVDKSTVPVNTGVKVAETIARYNKNNQPFDIVSNPEFLREGSAIHDSMHADRIVIGVSSDKAAEVMKEVYEALKAPIIVTDIKSAEIIKHASNSFLAIKISFINAVSRICDATGADVDEVAYGMGLDKRIGRSFLNAGVGYGGSCFPKDVSAFIKIGEQLGYDFGLLKEVELTNQNQIQYFIKKIEDVFWVLKGKKIAVWGLAFKANTDDMREAPSMKVIRHLLSEGAEIVAYDPEAMENAQRIIPELHCVNDPYEALKGAEGLIIHTEWDEFRNADLEKVKSLLEHPLIVDGRNLYEREKMMQLGFEYISMGRPSVKPAPIPT